MSFPEPYYIDTNGIRMAVYEDGPKDGMPLVLCHGWPEIAYAWRKQFPALAAAGYRVIAPDQRGYNRTQGPKGKENVPQYDMAHLTGDLVGLLDALGIEKAVFAGHDWGGFVVWQMPLMHPNRVAGVIGVNTPFMPRRREEPIATMRRLFGEAMYIVQFQNFGESEKVLEQNTARAMRFFYRRTGVKLADYDAAPAEFKTLDLIAGLMQPEEQWPGTPLLTPEEHAYYTEAFERSGWEGGINWYRNFTRNWEMSEDQDEHIHVPCLMVSAEDDIMLRPSYTSKMDEYIADLEKHVIADCGHWTQIEQTQALNSIMLDWLKRKFG